MKLFRPLALILPFFASVLVAHAELIPAARVVDWSAGSAVGVPGGIPTNRTRLIDVTKAPYNADNAGSANATPAIAAAIAAAVAGDVVYLPAGTYRMDTGVSVGPTKSNITIRGAGSALTKIDYRGNNSAFHVGSSSDYSWAYPTTGNTVTGGLSKGSTTITMASTSAFGVGKMVGIAVENQSDKSAIAAGATPVIHVSGYDYSRRQITRVVSKTATTLTISPGLYFTPDAGLNVKVNASQSHVEKVGIEDLAIDGTNGTMIFPINFEQCYASWIKGVRITNTSNYGLNISRSMNCEVRQCWISERKGGGTNGAGILVGTVSASLFEDNVLLKIFPAVEVNFSSMGNVFGYNVMENSVGGTLNTNHGPHNSFNLYEGNVTPNVQSDGYFGSASDDTFFRNWIHGTDSTRTLHTFTVGLNRFTRNYSFVGNIIGHLSTSSKNPYSFGNPNMGNASYVGSVQPSAGTFWTDWNSTAALTVRLSDTAGAITLNSGKFFLNQLGVLRWESNKRSQFSVSSIVGNVATFNGAAGNALPALSTVQVFMGPGGYQELDLDVGKTTYLKANYNYMTGAIPAIEALASDTLPPSMYRSSKPTFFGDLPWPAFNPLNPNPEFTSIPAGYRYVKGTSVPGSDSPEIVPAPVEQPAATLTAPSNVRIN